jgi:hypothetical protein
MPGKNNPERSSESEGETGKKIKEGEGKGPP